MSKPRRAMVKLMSAFIVGVDAGSLVEWNGRDLLLFWLWSGIVWLVCFTLAVAWPETADGRSVEGA